MKPNWANARLDSLTVSQVKALLVVASESPPDWATIPHRELLETAAHEATSVQELTRIKDSAKVLMKQAEEGPQREAAQLLYHLAVAAAFVRHGAEISGRPMRKQQLLYERFAARWAGHTIGEVFREAATRVSETNQPE